jgi:hypothetical protein
MAKATLLNSMGATTYVAFDLVPGDISAEDTDANTITVSGTALNGAATKSPLLTVVTNGTLSASSESNPDGKILVNGSTMQQVAHYKFTATRENFNVDKLTVLNVPTIGANFTVGGTVATSAVSQVEIKYTDMNGVQQTKTGSLSGGKATFSGLTFYVAAGTDASVDVYADVSTMAAVGETLSGQAFRLGIQDTANTISTFNAVGSSSSNTVNNPTFVGMAGVNQYLVRKSVPTFAKASGLSSNLGSGILYGLTITADSAGAIGFGRLVFNVNNTGVGNLSSFKFKKAGTLMSAALGVDKANIWNSIVGSDLAGAGTIAAHANNNVVVSFNQEETIAGGSSQTYTLEATPAGFANTDSVTTKLAADDDINPVTSITNPNTCTGASFVAQANTGRIFDGGNADCALFSGAGADFAQLAPLAPGAGVSHDIIWSDKSVNSVQHQYPTMTGSVPGTDGSYDWTNGYLLKVSSVASQSVSQ